MAGSFPESTVYKSVVEFVESYLSVAYARDVTTGYHVWCPQWWQHTEAVVRLDSLWRSWEFHRLDGATGLSEWWIGHADPHMRVLLDPNGPFKACSALRGHRDSIGPLPLQSPPPGVFGPSESP